ncbi:MAG TPA: Lrp/AsnC family transcriptional regulator [Clostridia bacterium]
MLDPTDFEIIKLLSQNSRMQWREIGESVHLTGQAVKNRIDRLESLGIIKGYTLRINHEKLGSNIIAFVTIFMKTTNHLSFKKFLEVSDLVIEAHRISGEGCYMLKVHVPGQQQLTDFLDSILKYGNYRVNLSIDTIK